jgi:hypothetical protein
MKTSKFCADGQIAANRASGELRHGRLWAADGVTLPEDVYNAVKPQKERPGEPARPH